MIRSIEIQGFRGIKEGKLNELTPLVVLVGPNGCGKSAVLDALLIGAHPIPANAMQLIAEQRLKVDGGTRWLFYKANRQVACEIIVTTVENSDRTIRLEQSQNGVRFVLMLRDRLGTDDLPKKRVEFGSIVDKVSLPADSRNFNLQGVSSIGFVDVQLHQTPLHQLFSQVVQQGQRALANEIIRDVVPKLSHIEILTEGDVPVIHLVYDDYSVPAALSGDGIHALLQLCLELASRPDGVVLLEEPEVHQHPGAIRQSARAILAAIRRGIQVVLTTHSLELIDFLLSETQSEEELNKISIRRLQLKDGCLKSSNLSGSEAAFARKEIEDDLR